MLDAAGGLMGLAGTSLPIGGLLARLGPMGRHFALWLAVWIGMGTASADVTRPGPALESRILVKDGQKVAFLGDSITAGGATHGRYCRLVVHGLKARGVRVG